MHLATDFEDAAVDASHTSTLDSPHRWLATRQRPLQPARHAGTRPLSRGSYQLPLTLRQQTIVQRRLGTATQHGMTPVRRIHDVDRRCAPLVGHHRKHVRPSCPSLSEHAGCLSSNHRALLRGHNSLATGRAVRPSAGAAVDKLSSHAVGAHPRPRNGRSARGVNIKPPRVPHPGAAPRRRPGRATRGRAASGAAREQPVDAAPLCSAVGGCRGATVAILPVDRVSWDVL